MELLENPKKGEISGSFSATRSAISRHRALDGEYFVINPCNSEVLDVEQIVQWLTMKILNGTAVIVPSCKHLWHVQS